MPRAIDEDYGDFRLELAQRSLDGGVSESEAFFEAYERVATENGDCIDLQPVAPNLAGQSIGVEGFAVDLERATLHLAVCDHRRSDSLETLIASDIARLKRQAAGFVRLCASGASAAIREAGPAAEAVAAALPTIRRIRVVIFSNAKLSTRRPPEADGELGGVPAVYNIMDFTRFAGLRNAGTGNEPIEIRLADISSEPLVCLPASGAEGLYRSCLVAVPATTLAEIYGLYGARLLEQNVRTFLQARTKVNKGIIRTLRETPEMFFAYNNGLTATAAGIVTETLADGRVAIRSITGLQIVNGGQTTASILYARDRGGADLSGVFVQMKLSVVEPARLEEVVPKISRYANTQNRVSEADFFSSHPFHVAMEQISRRLTAPPAPGHVSGSKWFYERARGQYREGMAGTPAARRRFAAEFPKGQLIDKTDLAKSEMVFGLRPHTVCLGSQKCFMAFAERIAKEWDASPHAFNEGWYRNAVARGILVRWTDQMIAQAEWYRSDRGFKSQTVAYTLAWVVERARLDGGRQIDLSLVWSLQDVPEELREVLAAVAPRIAAALRKTPEGVSNVAEYAKHQGCWAAISRLELDIVIPEAVLIEAEEAAAERRDAIQVQRMDSDIVFETLLASMSPAAAGQIADLARRERLLSPRSDAALRRLRGGDFLLPPGDRTALRQLLGRMAEQGLEIPVGEASEQEVRRLKIGSGDMRQVRA